MSEDAGDQTVKKTPMGQGREVSAEASSLSNLTLAEAVEGYVSEVIGWFQGFSPEVRKELDTIESKVNELARTGDAEKLKEVLMAYKKHLEETVKTLRAEGVKAGALFDLYRRHDRASR